MMRSPIPKAIRDELAQDPWMKTCSLSGYNFFCKGKIQWHHSMTYAGKRVNEIYAILPVCEAHHDKQAELRQPQEHLMRTRIKEFNAEADFKRKFPRSDLFVIH